ncbi:MAG: hypothetical protein GY748_22215, partial [Planctomycetaceae bacterium]|nr:hypothetical protein [Planctomycetaceae bacterium]
MNPKAAGLHRTDSFNDDDVSDDDGSLFTVEDLDEIEVDERKPAAKRTKRKEKKGKSKKETARLKDPPELDGQTEPKYTSTRKQRTRSTENHKSPAEEHETKSPAFERGATTANEARATKSPPSKNNKSPAKKLGAYETVNSEDEKANTPNIDTQTKKKTQSIPENAIVVDSLTDVPIPKRKRETSKDKTTKDDKTQTNETSSIRNERNAEYKKNAEAYRTTAINKIHPGLCDEYKLHLAKFYASRNRMNGFPFTSPKKWDEKDTDDEECNKQQKLEINPYWTQMHQM